MGMKRLHLRVPAREDWGRFCDASIEGGGVFCPCNEPPEVGQPVRVEITFIAGPRFFLKGIVTWRRPRLKDPRTRAGAGIRVDPKDRSKLSYVSAWARGGMLDKRGQRRLPVRLRATYSSDKGRRLTFTRDLCETGLFLHVKELLKLHAPVRLMLAPPTPEGQTLALQGTIVRLVDEPGERGMGIQLKFPDRQCRDRFAAFVHWLEQRYLRGQLPDEVIS